MVRTLGFQPNKVGSIPTSITMIGDIIYIPGDGSELTKAFAKIGIKVEWKPIVMPLFKMSDIKPIILDPEECKKHRFTFAVPNKPIDGTDTNDRRD